MDGGYDFLKYDQVWQRVAPGLEPWSAEGTGPDTRTAGDGTRRGPDGGQEPGPPWLGQQPVWSPNGTPEDNPDRMPGNYPDRKPGDNPDWMPGNALNGRPGNAPDRKPGNAQKPGTGLRPGGPAWKPCPPGPGTDGPEALADFIQEELSEQRQFQALGRTAPAWARPALRELSARCAAHAKRLSAAYYLTTGERYSPAASLGPALPGPWGPALRERYQSQVCAGLRYARAAERTEDPCMERLLEDLSGEAYRSAADLLRLLERGNGA